MSFLAERERERATSWNGAKKTGQVDEPSMWEGASPCSAEECCRVESMSRVAKVETCNFASHCGRRTTDGGRCSPARMRATTRARGRTSRWLGVMMEMLQGVSLELDCGRTIYSGLLGYLLI